ncbi:MAG: alpha/beta hydrolase [Planctomycetaceae bacterium]|nr:alpha/beta hydrolase [Planctomycetaceae bacterium]
MSARRQHLIFLTCVLLPICGCTTVQFVELREKPPNPIMERLTRTAFGGASVSERTRQFMQQTSYQGGANFAHMLHHARRQIGTGRHREALHAASEISYLASEEARSKDRPLAMELCLDAARFSWRYLTDPLEGGRVVDPNTPPHRQTAEVYNTSVESFLRMLRSAGQCRLGEPVQLPLSDRIIEFEIPHPSPGLTMDQLGEFRFVSDYEIKNLRSRHTSDGIGTPLIVKRAKTQHPLEGYYAEGLSYPVTAVLRFDSAYDNSAAKLEVYDGRESEGLAVAGNFLPLQTDISTPLAWFLTDPRKSLLDTFAFLRVDKAQDLEGLYMVQPYDPNRIPVLMVHGIWSSPVTWMEMFNDLQSDPILREKYQFWFYLYPTGQPLTFAAAGLRERLKELRMQCDPHGRNAKLDQMVVVGHSMGGLMSYLLTIDSEDKLWNAMSRVPVAEFAADEATREEIQRVFFFEGDDSVDRIVTIASPFNGSGYANRFTRWLSGSLISLPNMTSQLSELIYQQNNQNFWDRMFTSRTSVDSLNKNSAVLRLVSQTKLPDAVAHHNIVGVSKGRSVTNMTDGVVTFRSAHRDNVTSEIRVPASHSEAHRHPDSVAEVRRILLLHLKELQQKQRGVIQIRHQPSRQADFGQPLAP